MLKKEGIMRTQSALSTYLMLSVLVFVALGAVGRGRVSLEKVNAAEGAVSRPFGDVQVLATVPTPPGFPEGIAVRGDKVYVAGPARFGTAGDGQSSNVSPFHIRTAQLVHAYAL